ncbi:MAG: aminoglycoside phosphotransferase family protein [Candidatus Omnitrophica bacterium]|nr:aminoglycoside phosphotransferase family protein [Candidatus Omnitrophota bacterium]
MTGITIQKQEYFADIFAFWDFKLKAVHSEVEVTGSPERTESREVIEDDTGKLFILEEIDTRLRDSKLKIIETLDFLEHRGFSFVQPYCKTLDGKYIISHKKRSWQLVSYITGVTLNRPDYIFDKWRGPVLAEFLIQLKVKARNIPYFEEKEAFSIKNFIDEFIAKLSTHNPELVPPVKEPLRWLESKFFKEYENIPLDFCHGDYHPLNIIWGPDHIKKVIDWEFLGSKPEIYDLANLIGCIGMEDPEGLHGELIVDLIKTLKMAEIYSQISWDLLFEFIVALRFAWLSEWLHKHDDEMVSLESVYINLLFERRVQLLHCWEL